MEKGNEEKKYVCKFCNKECVSGKSLGGHIRSHMNEYAVDSGGGYNAERRFLCRECSKGFGSFKSLCAHLDCHGKRKKKKVVVDKECDGDETPVRKRYKKVVMKQESNGSLSSGSEIDQHDRKGALSLIKMSRESSGFKKGNSLGAESSDNNSVIVETKSSSGEEIKVDEVDDGVSSCDSDGSDSDYFMNGPKKSESDISVDGSIRNTGSGSGFKRFRNSDEFVVKEGGLMSKSKRVLHFDETDSCDRSSGKKSPMAKKVSGTKKNSDGHHECPYCSRVFKSGQALGGHKRSHNIGNKEHQVAENRKLFDLNVPAPDSDE